jgi:acyl-homoserine lactone acylase PvdQ
MWRDDNKRFQEIPYVFGGPSEKNVSPHYNDTYVLYNEKNDVHCFSLPEFVDPV